MIEDSMIENSNIKWMQLYNNYLYKMLPKSLLEVWNLIL